jgi:hypothetical protein
MSFLVREEPNHAWDKLSWLVCDRACPSMRQNVIVRMRQTLSLNKTRCHEIDPEPVKDRLRLPVYETDTLVCIKQDVLSGTRRTSLPVWERMHYRYEVDFILEWTRIFIQIWDRPQSCQRPAILINMRQTSMYEIGCLYSMRTTSSLNATECTYKYETDPQPSRGPCVFNNMR